MNIRVVLKCGGRATTELIDLKDGESITVHCEAGELRVRWADLTDAQLDALAQRGSTPEILSAARAEQDRR